ncbi:helix-turn-helix domain-containing protein [Rhodococcus hoagii]|nr:helix-turn-helix domain-containing protein [Prescottella equi]
MNRFKKLDPQTMTERKRHLGELIQQRRAELNLTQEEVAQLGGIHSETLRQYEIGRGGDTPHGAPWSRSTPRWAGASGAQSPSSSMRGAGRGQGRLP